MTILQFCSLSADLQRQMVKQKGVFLLGRTGVHVTIKLYQVDSFYVEIFFDEKMTQVIRLAAFDDISRLEPYLRQVNISEVEALFR